METFFAFFSGGGLYVAFLLLLLLCGVGNPVPEDLVLLTAGYFAYASLVELWPVVLVCYVGVVAGDSILYFFGRHYGQRIISHRWLARILPADRLERIRKNFQRRGHWTILLARFLVGLRSPTFLVSGVLHVRFRTFLLLDAIGAVVSVPFFVGLGYLFGNNIESIQQDMQHVGHWIMAIGIGLLLVWVWWIWWRVRREEVAEERERQLFQGPESGEIAQNARSLP
ncbi:MAG: DedA family protein [Deltaproteobacteria bacterium]|nr:DedA family protein [Deltaproteobacteria bacterium]